MSRKVSIFIGVGIILILAWMYPYMLFKQNGKNNVYTIAYIGRYNSPDERFSDRQRSRVFNFIHEFAFTNYISEFNESSDIQLEIKIHDNYRSPDSTRAIYKRIVQDSSVLLVLDNTWGIELAGAADIIRNAQMPVISLNADKNNIDYGNSAVFLGGGDLVPEDLVKFIQQKFDASEINFISETNYKLHDQYLQLLQDAGIGLRETIFFDSHLLDDEFSVVDLRDLFANDLITLLNTHTANSAHIINKVNFLFEEEVMVATIQAINDKELDPFTYNNKLYLINPVIIKDLSVQREFNRFQQLYPDIISTYNVDYFLKRCDVAWHVVENSLYGMSEMDRATFRRLLRANVRNGIDTDSLRLHFDDYGFLIQDYKFTMFSKDNTVTMDWEELDNLIVHP